MATIRQLVKSLRKIAHTQQQLIGALERHLRSLNHGGVTTPRLAKRLRCPRCTRRFARPVHLGRHLSATHHRKLRAR